MSNISNYRIIFHFFHVFKSNNFNVSCSCDENVNFLNNIFHSYNFVSLHTGLKSAYWIALSNIYSCSTASHCLSTSFSNISETANHYLLAWNHDISSSINSIHQRVFASIYVIKFRFGNWIIDINARANKFFFSLVSIETSNSCSGLFRNSLKIFC